MVRGALPLAAGVVGLILLIIAGMHLLDRADGKRSTSLTFEAGGESAARVHRVHTARPTRNQRDLDPKNRAPATGQRRDQASVRTSGEPIDSIEFESESTENAYRAIGEPLDVEVYEAADQGHPPLAIGEVLDADDPQGDLWEQAEGEVVRIGATLDADEPLQETLNQALPVYIGEPLSADGGIDP